ncbi:ADP-ribose pyrophosphatase, mitochondrial [Thelohanellus kitauei]|uniref:ADP-ribose pyrophosphatase, mitochondrial n=1 Tax=Thelohanellus kitauei TaxID=669202 RepID=A0A0C2IDJ9_THEKT|nr:ADP-ribose pyrophosphatase, mitochondrial [Thelohanellus kitauei]
MRYPGSSIDRAQVMSNFVSWDIDYPGYNPPYYTSKTVLKRPPWADPESTEGIKFNQLDGNVNRISFHGHYQIIDSRPRNPFGRKGIAGRGRLGKWGPNHAVDIVVCRWLKNKRIEFVCIERRDNGRNAFPGGMIDNGETAEQATIREAMEEIFNIPDSALRDRAHKWLIRNVPKGINIYQGYVGDSRATDNSWIETSVTACLENSDDTIDFPIVAGDDAASAFWTEANSKSKIFGGHKSILETLCEKLGAKF